MADRVTSVVIEAHDLTKTYDGAGAETQALRGVSLTINGGEFTASWDRRVRKSELMHILGLS